MLLDDACDSLERRSLQRPEGCQAELHGLEHENELGNLHVVANRSTSLELTEQGFERRIDRLLHRHHVRQELFGVEEHMSQEHTDKCMVTSLQPKLCLNEVDEYAGCRSLATLEVAQPSLHAALEIDHERDNNVFLGLEVVVDGSFAYIGCDRDLVDGDRLDALLRKQSDGCVYDLSPRSALLSFTSRLEPAYDYGHL